MSEWFEDWFSSEQYLNVYKHRDQNDALLLLDLIHRTISIKNDFLILDAACGAGRYSNLLLQKGYKVIGFDLSLPLLKIAKTDAGKISGENIYFRSDIRSVKLKMKFNLILNVFTSFGYFVTDEENFSFINNSITFLKKKGYFVFDYINKQCLIDNLIPYSQKEIDGYLIEEKRKIENQRVIKEINISKGNERHSFTESVKLYSPGILFELFSKTGYKIIDVFGSYEGENFSEINSSRIIIIGQNEG